MSNFWHFGDSFAYNDFSLEPENIQHDNFGYKISKKFNLEYKFNAATGASNEQIFNSILRKNNNFNKGDFIFVNWSFFSRGTYVDVDKILDKKEWEFELNKNDYLIKSTNRWFNENNMKYAFDTNLSKFIINYKFIMDYILEYNFDYNLKLFDKIFTFFKTLEDRGVKIYNLFIRESEFLNHKNEKIKLKFKDDVGSFVKFEPSYFEWLVSNNYKDEVEGHYSEGIQELLANEIMNRMN
jgi:hypothetical protein